MSECSTARTCQFRVQLTRDGRRWLDDRHAAHCRRYNAAWRERRDAWRMARRSINFAYGEGYDRGTNVVHQEFRDWRPGQHGPGCVCDCWETGCGLCGRSLRSVLPRGDPDHQRGDSPPPAQRERGPGIGQWSCRPSGFRHHFYQHWRRPLLQRPALLLVRWPRGPEIARRYCSRGI